eukprot:CAMPEP_0198329280 /NCGR_PEP_ID=MMETSP1450-20131203/16083_1 /TAXON_ID=753684 ORGANISM="Madagascaria erythrocladiodes, Strain CCMP3234" /NCGR_SAMPLE_ID=MMETSP1450 /ASSEMBLY_ACC=CAM_ASM_001115 /LENGTH=38 /DNA_ID= /DNA_START= /DNA_END= /DNA_ORIENTATION=
MEPPALQLGSWTLEQWQALLAEDAPPHLLPVPVPVPVP